MFKKIFLGCLIALILVPLFSFIAYDLRYFQPHRQEIARLLAQATDDEKHPPENLLRLLKADAKFTSDTRRILMSELEVAPVPKYWHARTALWNAMVFLHLSEQERMTISLSRSYMGNRIYGFSAASAFYFQKPLARLNLEENATLVALTFAPASLSNSPERLVKRRDMLLRKLENAP